MRRIEIYLLLALGICGCSTASITDYTVFEYDNAKALVAEGSPTLTPYTTKGTILTPILKQGDHTSQILHLTLWGSDNAFTVERISFLGGVEFAKAIRTEVNMSTLTANQDGSKSLILLQKVPNSTFGTEKSSVVLALTIQMDKQTTTFKYPITKSTRTYFVQR
jgi:hypothetical protein